MPPVSKMTRVPPGATACRETEGAGRLPGRDVLAEPRRRVRTARPRGNSVVGRALDREGVDVGCGRGRRTERQHVEGCGARGVRRLRPARPSQRDRAAAAQIDVEIDHALPLGGGRQGARLAVQRLHQPAIGRAERVDQRQCPGPQRGVGGPPCMGVRHVFERTAAGMEIETDLAARQQHALDIMRDHLGRRAVVSPGKERLRLPPSIGETRRPARTAGRLAALRTTSRPWSRAGSSARTSFISAIWPS